MYNNNDTDYELNTNEKKIEEDIIRLNSYIQKNAMNINEIDKKLLDITLYINGSIKNNETAANKIQNILDKEFPEIKQQVEDIKFKILKNIEDNDKLSNNILEINNCIKKSENNINNLKNKVIEDISETNDNLDLSIKNIKKDIHKNEDDVNDLKNEVKGNISNIKETLDNSISNLKQEILNLQDATNFIKERQNDNTDLEEFKKNYNQYINKVDDALDKINESILTIQEQNNETNKNIQVKIKAYIDSKNTSTINGLKDTISKLNLSIIEREKLQKIEMEQLLNKKIKEIQKENERILNKKIEEINNVMRKNLLYYRTNNVEPIDNYKKTDKHKKNMYDPIDTNVILKQTASSNKKLEKPETGKSQILKFFYDDEDID